MGAFGDARGNPGKAGDWRVRLLAQCPVGGRSQRAAMCWWFDQAVGINVVSEGAVFNFRHNSAEWARERTALQFCHDAARAAGSLDVSVYEGGREVARRDGARPECIAVPRRRARPAPAKPWETMPGMWFW